MMRAARHGLRFRSTVMLTLPHLVHEHFQRVGIVAGVRVPATELLRDQFEDSVLGRHQKQKLVDVGDVQ
jgi:hypothetical protein